MPRVEAEKRKRADLVAALIVVAVGAPLVWGGAAAFARGEQQRRVAPVRGLLGAQAWTDWEAWCEGEPKPAQHYVRPPLADPPEGCVRPRFRAPDFELPTRDGGTWRLSEHRGRVVVLNFWTVTCRPCMEEMPSLIELARILDGREDIELVTISVDRDWDTVRTAVPDDSPLTVLLDPEREVVHGRFGTRLFPETWVIDPDGIIRLRVDGRRDWSSALAIDAFESFL